MVDFQPTSSLMLSLAHGSTVPGGSFLPWGQQGLERAMAAANNLAALTALVTALCEEGEWILGEIWLPMDGGDRLVNCGPWYGADALGHTLGLQRRDQWVSPGTGLLGQVWAGWIPHWQVQSSDESEDPTLAAIARDSLVVGLPVSVGESAAAVVALVARSGLPLSLEVADWQRITSQWEAVIRLKDSETHLLRQGKAYQQLALYSQGILSYHSAQGETLEVSATCEGILGYRPGDIVGQSIQDLVHPEDRLALALAYRRLRRRGQSQTLTLRIQHQSGHYRWFETLVDGWVGEQSGVGVVALARDVTRQQETASTLKGQRQLLRLVLDSVPHQIFWKDTQGTYLGCNQAFAEAMGLSSAQDIIGLTDTQLTPYTLEEAAHLQHRDIQVMIGGEPDLHGIESQPHAEGGRRWVSVSRFPMYDQQGQIMGVMATLEDISDRLAAQQALARREKYMLALVEVQRQLLSLDHPWQGDHYQEVLAPLGRAATASRAYIYTLVPGQPYTQQASEWCSPGIESTVGHPKFTHLPTTGPFQPWFDRLAAGGVVNQTYDQFTPELQQILGEAPSGIQSILLLPLEVKGRLYGTVGFSNCTAPRPWSRTEVTLLQVAATALSLAIERHQAEDSLRLAEQKYRSMFENAVEGIFQSTLDGHYLTVNPMLAQIYGYDSPEELMATLTDIRTQLYVDPQRREVFVRQMMKQQSVLGFEAQVYRRDGSTIWISESARVIHDHQGQPTGFEGTVEDITARKQAEVALHHRDRLLQGVAQASQHLLTTPDLEVAIPQTLSILGNAADADRVYIYENHPHPDTGEPAMSLRYEWSRPGVTPSMERPLWQNLPYSSYGLQRWYRTFLSGQAIRGLVRHMPLSEQELLEPEDITSILMVPIFIDQTLWGYVGCDACGRDRRWTNNDESIFVTISASLGGAFNRQRAEAQMRYQAFHDTLTGLPNRVLFNQYLPMAIAQAQRSGQHLGVLFLDLDRFKTINDTLGHAVGDLLLKQATQRLKQALREEDIIARWGGDEFTLILPRLNSADEAGKVAQRLATLLRPPFLIAKQELYITSSIGIAIYPQHGSDVSSLLRHADAAMYRAKAAGRNTYCFYRATQTPESTQQLTIEKHLHHALDNEELQMFFQPQVNIATGRVTQVEALLRWQNPHLGWVMPQQFIPLAEEIGLITDFGHWVFHQVCSQLHQWHQLGITQLPVAVNLSARQLQQRSLPSYIAQLLDSYDLPPSCLELEITETAALLDIEVSTIVLQELCQLGVQIVMDDFGTGYSSLSYLKQLPLHGIKIDRAFVQEIPQNSQDVAMLRAIITLGQDLGLTMVAEGVETQGQLDCLRALGCDHVQGYLFSRPLPEPVMTQFLQRHWLEQIPLETRVP